MLLCLGSASLFHTSCPDYHGFQLTAIHSACATFCLMQLKLYVFCRQPFTCILGMGVPSAPQKGRRRSAVEKDGRSTAKKLTHLSNPRNFMADAVAADEAEDEEEYLDGGTAESCLQTAEQLLGRYKQVG